MQVGEARARDARARLHVDQLARELEVVAAVSIRRGSPTSRSVVSASAAVGSGGLGSEASAASSSASTPASSSVSALTPARDLLHLGDRRGRRPRPPSWPARSPCEASFWRARSPSTSGSSSRRRASSASASSSRASEPSPRRASARAHRLGVAADRLQVEHGRRASAAAAARADFAACVARVLRDEAARPPRPPRRPRCSAASGRRRSRRCGSRRGPLVRPPCAGRSSGRPCTRGLLALTAEPWVPATSSVWQPAQRWLKISAPSYSGLVLGDVDLLASRRRPRPRRRPEARGAAGGGA